MERTFIQSNIVDTPEVGKEYYIWDKVVGAVDADIVTVEALEGNQMTMPSMMTTWSVISLRNLKR